MIFHRKKAKTKNPRQPQQIYFNFRHCISFEPNQSVTVRNETTKTVWVCDTTALHSRRRRRHTWIRAENVKYIVFKNGIKLAVVIPQSTYVMCVVVAFCSASTSQARSSWLVRYVFSTAVHPKQALRQHRIVHSEKKRLQTLKPAERRMGKNNKRTKNHRRNKMWVRLNVRK